MSAFILARMESAVLCFSDGGLYHSVADFTMVGKASKISKYPHLSAVMVSAGKAKIRLMVDLNHSADWCSFDHMKEVIKKNVETELDRYHLAFPYEGPVTAVLAFAGWSKANRRFESYQLGVSQDEIGEVTTAPEIMFAPEPSKEALLSFGFDVDDNISISNPKEDLVRMMLAQRATPAEMGNTGAADCRWGHYVGAFIERVHLTREWIHCDIPVTWPDEVGNMIDLADEAVFATASQPG